MKKNMVNQNVTGNGIEGESGKGGTTPNPAPNPRDGWEESFQEMNAAGDDQLVIPDVFEDGELPD